MVAFFCPPPFMSVGAAALGLEYIDYLHDSSSLSSYLFDDAPIGIPSADRLVIICGGVARGIGGINITGADFDASPATLHVQSSSTNNNDTGIASLVVPSGATSDIGLSLSTTANSQGAAIFILTLKGYSSATPTATNFDGPSGGTHTSRSITQTIPAGGWGLYVHQHANTNPASWSGVDGNEPIVEMNVGGDRMFSIAVKTTDVELVNHQVDISWSGGTGTQTCCAAWA